MAGVEKGGNLWWEHGEQIGIKSPNTINGWRNIHREWGFQMI